MSPDWSDVVVVKTDKEQPGTHHGAYGRVYIDGHEIKNVSMCKVDGVIGGDDIPSITLEIEPKSIRIILESDLKEDEAGTLHYDSPRKLIIRR